MRQRGFTLIEIMIVVAIIAILATIGSVSYQQNILRAQVSEGLVLADPLQTSVADYINTANRWPTDMTALMGNGFNPTGQYVSGISLSNGTIQIRFGGKSGAGLAGQELDLRPGLSADHAVIWECGYHTVSPAPAYTDSFGTPSSASATTIDPTLLPAACR